MYMFRKNALEIREGSKLHWDMYGGGKLKIDKDTDSYWGRMLWDLNMICLKNLALSAAYGITADAITA
jgi:hypothetical protein